jgi:hypothetical protein
MSEFYCTRIAVAKTGYSSVYFYFLQLQPGYSEVLCGYRQRKDFFIT